VLSSSAPLRVIQRTCRNASRTVQYFYLQLIAVVYFTRMLLRIRSIATLIHSTECVTMVDSLHSSYVRYCPLYDACLIRGCIKKFQDWPPGARTANSTALCHYVQLYRYFVSQYRVFCRHNSLGCFSTSVYCYFVIGSVRKLVDTPSYTRYIWNWLCFLLKTFYYHYIECCYCYKLVVVPAAECGSFCIIILVLIII
jgi:hypothetical protein